MAQLGEGDSLGAPSPGEVQGDPTQSFVEKLNANALADAVQSSFKNDEVQSEVDQSPRQVSKHSGVVSKCSECENRGERKVSSVYSSASSTQDEVEINITDEAAAQDKHPSAGLASGSGSPANPHLEALLQRLELKLDALCEMPQQLQALQLLPKQLIALTSTVGNLKSVTSESITQIKSMAESAPASRRQSGSDFLGGLRRASVERDDLRRGSVGSTNGGSWSAAISGGRRESNMAGASPLHQAPDRKQSILTTSVTSENRSILQRLASTRSPNRHASSPGNISPSPSIHELSNSTADSIPSRSASQNPPQGTVSHVSSIDGFAERPEEKDTFDAIGPDDTSLPKVSESSATGEQLESIEHVDSENDPHEGKVNFTTFQTVSSVSAGSSKIASWLRSGGVKEATRQVDLFPSLMTEPESTPDTGPHSALNRSLTRSSSRAFASERSGRGHSSRAQKALSRFQTLAPDSSVRLAWDVLVILNTVLAGTIIPLTCVYYDRHSVPKWLDVWLLYVIDFIWPADIAMNFWTAFRMGGKLEHRVILIAGNYAKGWLLADLLAAWPLVLTERGSDAFVIACICKFPRILQLYPRFMRLRSRYFGNRVLMTCVSVLILMTVTMMACLWRLVLRSDGAPIDTEEWAIVQFVNDLYFISLTLTSVGYGDIVPAGTASRLYAIFVMLLGCTVVGACVTACSFVFQKIVNNEAGRRIAELTAVMRRRCVPRDLQRRVRENLHQHLVHSESTMLAPHLLASLSPAMRRELCLAILNDTLVRFPLFRNPQRSFVAELAQAHNWERVLPGDLVTDEGYAVQDLVFIMEGCLQAWLNSNSDGQLEVHISQATTGQAMTTGRGSLIAAPAVSVKSGFDGNMELRAGAWFGEASLFDEDRVYTAIITAMTTVELSVLPAHDYFRIVRKYPHLLERHNSIKRGVIAGNINLRGLRYTEELEDDVADARGVFSVIFNKLLGRSMETTDK